jgi:hypothetical protein
MTRKPLTDGLSNIALFSEWIRGKSGTSTFGLHQVYVATIPFPMPKAYVP